LGLEVAKGSPENERIGLSASGRIGVCPLACRGCEPGGRHTGGYPNPGSTRVNRGLGFYCPFGFGATDDPGLNPAAPCRAKSADAEEVRRGSLTYSRYLRRHWGATPTTGRAHSSPRASTFAFWINKLLAGLPA
jgi:hypothetical protein